MKRLMKFLLVLVSLGAICGAIGVGIILYVTHDLPSVTTLKNYKPAIPSKILSKDKVVLLEIGRENRELVEYDKIPKRIVDAFLSAEDDKFFEHIGIDLKGIVRATFKNIKAGRVVQGASTITQQVAKSLLLTNERTFIRKLKDLILALKIEQEFSKEEILFLYLNQVYLGGGYYGVKAAFEGYFEKDLNEASVAEAALIAGLLVAPGKYSPYVNPQYAKKRQNYVLNRMRVTGKITEEEYQIAKNEDIKMYLRKSNEMKAGYFTDWIRQRAIEKFGNETLLTGGLTIQTTLNWQLQKRAEEEVRKGVIEVDKRQGYKGPLGNLEEEEWASFFEKERESILKSESKFFVFKKNGEVELELKKEEVPEEEEEEVKLSKWYQRFYSKGNNSLSPFNKYIEKDRNYEGIVTKVNDLQQLVYVSFAGGLKGVIPYEYFRWAHEREISEKRVYWQYVKWPSKILKKGDKVLIKVISSPRKIWNYLGKKFKEKVTNEKLLEYIKKEKYYILSLEQEPEVQSALVSISPQSGEIVAMVGGYSFKKSQFNRAVQSNRQPGSAFKPLIFAAGLEYGYKPNSILLDTPSALGSSDESLDWKPSNYDGKFKGEMTYRRALEVSRNIPTIKLVQDLGVDKVRDFTLRFKSDLELPKDLSISLGSFGINLVELVKLYAVFPNKGKRVKLKSVLDIYDTYGKKYYLDADDVSENTSSDVAKVEDENLEEEFNEINEDEEEVEQNPFHANLSDEQIYDSRLAYIMNNLMKGIVQNGTGKSARSVSSFIGGKTGTTNNYVDAWFVGYSQNIATAVWTGFDNNQTLGFGETGARAALPIWKGFMKEGVKLLGDYDFFVPSGIINIAINPDSGKVVKGPEEKSMIEAFVEGHEPKADDQDDSSDGEDDGTFDDDDYYDNQ